MVVIACLTLLQLCRLSLMILSFVLSTLTIYGFYVGFLAPSTFSDDCYNLPSASAGTFSQLFI